MRVYGDLKENSIEWYKDDETATCSLTQGRYISKAKKLAEKYPDECKLIAENDDGSCLFRLPVSWIKLSANKREVSEEQKNAARIRLAKYRAEKDR